MTTGHEDIRRLIHAELDGELSPVQAAEVSAHLATCAACRVYAETLRAVRHSVASAGRGMVAPAGLAQRIRVDIVKARQPRFDVMGWLRTVDIRLRFASAVAAGAAFAVVALLMMQPNFNRDLLANHLQALHRGQLTEVEASDRQTLAPWFTQRLSYVPPVLAGGDVGCTLMGGRIADIAQHKTAALAYRCDQHVVTVYVEPSQKGMAPPQATTQGGYQVVSWRGPKLACQAVSDLDAPHLLRLARYIQAHARDV